MKVPSEIDPCPITEAIMEIRFDSELDEGAVFGIIYNQIKNEYDKVTNLPILEIPSSLRKQDPNLKYLPYYRLAKKDNENALIQIGPRVFSVIITNNYTGWKNFRPMIEYGLEKLEASGAVSKVIRFALRYINFFAENVLLKSNLQIQLNGKTLNSINSTLRFEIPNGDFLNILTVSNHANKSEPNGVVKGSTIDIDTILEQGSSDFFKRKLELLESCHDTEKKLFSDLLSEEYEKSLKKITYA